MRRYVASGSANQLAAQVGCSQPIMSRMLRKMPGYRPPKELNRVRIERKLRDGCTCNHAIARALGLSSVTVKNHRKASAYAQKLSAS